LGLQRTIHPIESVKAGEPESLYAVIHSARAHEVMDVSGKKLSFQFLYRQVPEREGYEVLGLIHSINPHTRFCCFPLTTDELLEGGDMFVPQDEEFLGAMQPPLSEDPVVKAENDLFVSRWRYKNTMNAELEEALEEARAMPPSPALAYRNKLFEMEQEWLLSSGYFPASKLRVKSPEEGADDEETSGMEALPKEFLDQSGISALMKRAGGKLELELKKKSYFIHGYKKIITKWEQEVVRWPGIWGLNPFGGPPLEEKDLKDRPDRGRSGDLTIYLDYDAVQNSVQNFVRDGRVTPVQVTKEELVLSWAKRCWSTDYSSYKEITLNAAVERHPSGRWFVTGLTQDLVHSSGASGPRKGDKEELGKKLPVPRQSTWFGMDALGRGPTARVEETGFEIRDSKVGWAEDLAERLDLFRALFPSGSFPHAGFDRDGAYVDSTQSIAGKTKSGQQLGLVKRTHYSGDGEKVAKALRGGRKPQEVREEEVYYAKRATVLYHENGHSRYFRTFYKKQSRGQGRKPVFFAVFVEELNEQDVPLARYQFKGKFDLPECFGMHATEEAAAASSKAWESKLSRQKLPPRFGCDGKGHYLDEEVSVGVRRSYCDEGFINDLRACLVLRREEKPEGQSMSFLLEEHIHLHEPYHEGKSVRLLLKELPLRENWPELSAQIVEKIWPEPAPIFTETVVAAKAPFAFLDDKGKHRLLWFHFEEPEEGAFLLAAIIEVNEKKEFIALLDLPADAVEAEGDWKEGLAKTLGWKMAPTGSDSSKQKPKD